MLTPTSKKRVIEQLVALTCLSTVGLIIFCLINPYLPTNCNERASFEFRARAVRVIAQHCKNTGRCKEVYWRRSLLPPYLNIYVTGTQDERGREEVVSNIEAINSGFQVKNCYQLKFGNP